MNEISVLIKETTESSLALFPPHEDAREPLPEPNHAGILISDFHPPEL